MAKVQRLSIQEIQEEPSQPPIATPDFSAMLGVFKAISAILAIRVLLFGAVTGSFVLGYISMAEKDTHGLWTLGIYCIFTVLPLVYLDIVTRTK